MSNQEDENAFECHRFTDENYVLKQQIVQLKKDLRDWKMRLSLATDFDQCEMDLRVGCVMCDVPFYPDYCHDRNNDGSDPVCDVCAGE